MKIHARNYQFKWQMEEGMNSDVAWPTIGSRQPKMAPYISIFPILTLTGRVARCCPRGVRRWSLGWHAPIFLSKLTALLTDWGWGASRARLRKSSGEPYSHFCRWTVRGMKDTLNRSYTTCQIVVSESAQGFYTIIWRQSSSSGTRRISGMEYSMKASNLLNKSRIDPQKGKQRF